MPPATTSASCPPPSESVPENVVLVPAPPTVSVAAAELLRTPPPPASEAAVPEKPHKSSVPLTTSAEFGLRAPVDPASSVEPALTVVGPLKLFVPLSVSVSPPVTTSASCPPASVSVPQKAVPQRGQTGTLYFAAQSTKCRPDPAVSGRSSRFRTSRMGWRRRRR